MHLNVFPSLGSRFFTSCCRPLHKVWHDHTKKSGSDNEQNLICCSSSTIIILAPLGTVTPQNPPFQTFSNNLLAMALSQTLKSPS